MKQGIVVVSFGTTVAETRAKNIGSVEDAVARCFPGCIVCAAWTSAVVRRVLHARGECVQDVDEALKMLAQRDVEQVVLLPTHLLYGKEYDKLCAQARQNSALFIQITIAPPLLACEADLRAVAQALHGGVATAQGEALVLMGHGTAHISNTVYTAMDVLCKAEGMPHVFVGTVEAHPDVHVVLKAVKHAGYRKAVLTPLMLVAGDHAQNDMASDAPQSWKSIFEAEGIACRTVLRGLGEYEAVRAIYLTHALQGHAALAMQGASVPFAEGGTVVAV